jgi:hypothetical protein
MVVFDTSLGAGIIIYLSERHRELQRGASVSECRCHDRDFEVVQIGKVFIPIRTQRAY